MAYTCSYCKTGVMNTADQYLTHINGTKHKKKAFQLQAPDAGIEYDEFKKPKPAKSQPQFVETREDFPSLTGGLNGSSMSEASASRLEYTNIAHKFAHSRPIVVYEDVEKPEDITESDDNVTIDDVFFKENSKIESARYIIQHYIKNNKTAAQALNEISKAMIWEVDFEPVSAKHLRYGMCVKIDSIEFATGEGENKKEAKQNAAAEAINGIKMKLRKNTSEPKSIDIIKRKEELNITINESPADCYQKLTKDKLKEIRRSCSKNFEVPKRYAAFIITERFDQHAREGTVVAFGAGVGVNCSIEADSDYPGYYMKNFDALVLAKRSLQCFFYNQILMIFDKKRQQQKGEKIYVEINKNGYVKFKYGCRLHLYMSHAPQGDCIESIPRNWEEPTKLSAKEIERDRNGNMDPIMYMSYSQSTLLKEPGHIRILKDDSVDEWISLVNYRFKNKYNRNMTLSPTDKLMAWIHLGIQGGLLSHLMCPVYIYSIQFGKNYIHEHISRALLCRVPLEIINNNKTHYYESVKFFDPYLERVSEIHPDRFENEEIDNVTVSFNWYLNPVTEYAEVIDNETGCVHPKSPFQLPGGEPEGKCSRLSRVCMIMRLKEAILAAIEYFAMRPEFQRTRYLQGINEACNYNYNRFKSSSADFRRLKQSLFESLATKHYGEWLPNIGTKEFNLTELYEI